MGVKQDIINYCLSLGIDSVGFIKVRRFDELKDFFKYRKEKKLENEFEESELELRIDANKWFDGGKTIISIAFPYLYVNNNIQNGFSVYTRGIDYHFVVNKYLNEICKIIESYGGKAKGFVDSNSLPERYLAYISGVGFIGKNNLVITEKHGSYTFLAEIITDLEIYDEDKRTFDEIDLFKECGECNICYSECPTKAINPKMKNCNICLSYITQKKELEDWEIQKLDGRVFGCDSCQLKCPYNEKAENSVIEEFKAMDFMNENNEDFIINMGNSEFKDTFKKTSCGWRGKNVLKRNTMIRKALYLNDGEIEKIKFESPYLNEYRDRIIKK
ncbi:tRNA epoxyqueuosine(34) reductase QueG [Clostridium sp. SM-530-WT-3G]|uniref:tRNA epoxyqueuosine(34) reductase QueG n=1 Tax=Clostridium sp. SM-530-WT-3G TaxID=2725303 RepID=UPI00145D16F6|nr:tRNA epoxyqueuosine(34) reductase QueG [Clostridium sp. SM-530-WT-3G]NME82202.1 tRNA epoxyqueuosine(34) reductase QueG [Clostridium sp. SM-530-WT-3G]